MLEPMTTADEISARLTEFHLVYEGIHTRRSELKDLQQAEQAQAEYKSATSKFDRELAELAEAKSDLEIELRKQRIREESGETSFRPPPPPVVFQPRADPAPFLEDKPEVTVAPQAARKGPRLELQKLVGKYGRLWKLSTEIRGSINRIAEDPGRPLGEALSLLEWSTFENQIKHRETEADHLKRLDEWGQALVEYRDWLDGEIDMLLTKYRRVLPIMKAWVSRDTAEGQERWNQQIAATLAAKETELEGLAQDVEKLKAELNQLRAHA